MKNDTKKFKYILNFVTFLYGVNIFGIVALLAGGILSLFLSNSSFVGQHEFSNGWSFTLMSGTFDYVSLLTMLYSTVMMFLLLGTIRKFLKNLIADEIFITENVTLAKRASFFLLLASFDGGSEAVLAVNGSGFINLTFIFAALLIWVFAKLLEKAVVIAEENEFTI
ncbi:DUF2975 domain-containing protein [Streptococcus equinus]|uniref:DUF2975 domain-containing protein n=1 Tax=Streptococcus equinus TaxID=1335 RepID=UPI003BF84D57